MLLFLVSSLAFSQAYIGTVGVLTTQTPVPPANGGTGCATPYAVNPQTSTYQVVAADFTCQKTILIASGTFTITLVASGSQPGAGLTIYLLNYGSGVITVARSGQNINGVTTSQTLAAGSAAAPTSMSIQSDGTNYFAGNVTPSGGGGSSSELCTRSFAAGTTITAPGANETNCVYGAQSAQTNLTISGANATIWVAPGVKITQASNAAAMFAFTGTNSGIVGGGGIGGILDGNSDSAAQLITLAGTGQFVNGITVQNYGTTNPAIYSVDATNPTVDRLTCLSASYTCVKFSSGASTNITGAVITNGRFSSPASSGATGARQFIVLARPMGALLPSDITISNNSLNIQNTAAGGADGISVEGQAADQQMYGVRIIGNNCTAIGTLNACYHLFGISHAVISGNTTNQNGNYIYGPGFNLGDMFDSTVTGNQCYQPGGGACISNNDGSRNVFSSNSIDGTGGGISPNGGIVIFTNGSSAGNCSYNNIVGNTIRLTSGQVAPGIYISASLVSGGDNCSGNSITGNIILGTGTASQGGISITTAGASTVDSNLISNNQIINVATGITIGSGVTATNIGPQVFKTVTTRFSDSGTGTILSPFAVADVTQVSKTTAQTAATLFTPDADAGYRVGLSVNCDNTSAAATVNGTIGWTDPSNQAQTQSFASAAACTALGSTSFGQLFFPFRAKSGTNITYATSIVNTPTYDVSVHLEQVTTK